MPNQINNAHDQLAFQLRPLFKNNMNLLDFEFSTLYQRLLMSFQIADHDFKANHNQPLTFKQIQSIENEFKTRLYQWLKPYAMFVLSTNLTYFQNQIDHYIQNMTTQLHYKLHAKSDQNCPNDWFQNQIEQVQFVIDNNYNAYRMKTASWLTELSNQTHDSWVAIQNLIQKPAYNI